MYGGNAINKMYFCRVYQAESPAQSNKCSGREYDVSTHMLAKSIIQLHLPDSHKLPHIWQYFCLMAMFHVIWSRSYSVM